MKPHSPKILATFLFSSFLSTQVLAEALWPVLETKTCSPVATLSLGPAAISHKKAHSFFLEQDGVNNEYFFNRKEGVFGSGDIFLGWQVPISLNLLGQIGVDLAGSFDIPVSGKVRPAVNPAALTYNYRYKLNHRHVAIKAKLLSNTNTIIQPYVSAGFGAGSNQESQFKIKPMLTQFTDNHSTGYVYTLGIGAQYVFNLNWQAGVGYEFADWGQGKNGGNQGQTLNIFSGSGRLYANQLLFSLTYVFTPERATRS